MDAAQAITVLYDHAGMALDASIAILGEAAREGEATTPSGYLIVCNDPNMADPRFSVCQPGGGWLSAGSGPDRRR